jgi:hypothetical protein
MLDVVEDEQDSLLAEVRRQSLLQRPIARLAETECPGNGGKHERRVAQRRERHVGDVVEDIAQTGRRLEGEPSLAHPAGADQGEKGDVGAEEQVAQPCQLPLPPNQRGARQRQSVRATWGQDGLHRGAVPSGAL